jgi:O-antigen/teichoic acid export membrane protein
MFGVLFTGGCVAAASQWRRLSIETRPAVLGDWMRSHRSIGVPLFLDFLASSGLTSLALFLLAGIDIEQAAGLRGAQMVAAPVTLLHVALVQALTAEGARLRLTKPEAIERFGWYALGAMIAGGVVFLGVVALGESTVLRLLGDSGPATGPVLFPMIAFTIAAAPALAATGILRSRDQSKRALRARLLSSVPFAVALVVGAVLDGARGVAIGGTVAQLLTAGIWWRAVVSTRP